VKKFFKISGIIVLLLLTILVIIGKTGAFDMAKSNDEIIEAFNNQNASPPDFSSYKIGDNTIGYMSNVYKPFEPTIIFFHGSPGSKDAYLDYFFYDKLQAYNLISVDRPGYGNSGKGYAVRQIEDQAKLFKPLLEKYENEDVVLVGHSLGGPIIARMAMDYPALIDGLVIVAGSVDPEAEPKNWWRKIFDIPPFRWLLPSSLKVCNQEIIPAKSELEKMLPLWETLACNIEVVHGDMDKLVPVANAHFVADAAVNANVNLNIIKGKGHFILWENVAEIEASIVNCFPDNTAH